ncbi:MAG: hypothetical protein KF914_20225 [Rhizobiaceae bacterium]|nr:hypothetical protein [Rhizobiaceae bacterium]
MNITKRPARSRVAVSCVGALALTVVILPGCMSSVPQAVAPTEPPQGALNTGTYPNLNIPPQSAAAPISEDDKARIESRLGGAQQRQSASGRGAGTRGNPLILQQLAARHGDDTLDAIAGR